MRWLTHTVERSRAAWREALRVDGSIESKLVLLSAAALTLFCSLVVTLFFVQHALIGAQAQLTTRTLPTTHALGQLEAALAAAFQRQSRISSTRQLAQLEPLRNRAPLERTLVALPARIGAHLGGDDAASAASLATHVNEFLAADAALLQSVERRLQRQALFEKELAEIDASLRELIETAHSLHGVLYLDYVLVLRQLAAELRTGAPSLPLVRAALLGGMRGQLDDVSELVDAVASLGWLAGKTGLALTDDTLNSIVANEINQNAWQVERLLASLAQRADTASPAAERIHRLTEQYHALAPRIADETRAVSLVRLRRQVLTEARHAASIREDCAGSAQRLTADTARLQTWSQELAEATASSSEHATRWARAGSLLVSLLGLCICVFVAGRIRHGVRALRATNRELTGLRDHLRSANSDLEVRVVARTRALVERHRAMQVVMDSLTEGLLSIDLDGRMRGVRSRTVTDWFGPPDESLPVWAYLYGSDPTAEAFAVGFAQIADQILPFEVSAAQMPSRLQRDGRSFDLEFRAVRRGGGDELDAVLLVLRDVTAQRQALQAERQAREEHALIANLLRDKRGFQAAVAECGRLVREVMGTAELRPLRRALHTLKGSCAVAGFHLVSEVAHQLESRLDDNGRLTAADLAPLEQRWREASERLEEFLDPAHAQLDIAPRELAALLERLRARAGHGELIALVEAWHLEPVSTPLHRLAAQAQRIAERIGKRVRVDVAAHGVRLPENHYRAFWSSLVHAARNAVDHGIESAAERRAAGKPEAGRLSFTATCDAHGRVVISISDDGAGVDFERLRSVAAARGLPHATREDLVEALFTDGISGRTEVTDLSGRGVGASVLRHACEALGGQVVVETEPGRGTTLRFVLPPPPVQAEAADRALAAG